MTHSTQTADQGNPRSRADLPWRDLRPDLDEVGRVRRSVHYPRAAKLGAHEHALRREHSHDSPSLRDPLDIVDLTAADHLLDDVRVLVVAEVGAGTRQLVEEGLERVEAVEHLEPSRGLTGPRLGHDRERKVTKLVTGRADRQNGAWRRKPELRAELEEPPLVRVALELLELLDHEDRGRVGKSAREP